MNRRVSLGSAFDPRNNALNFLRLVFASCVIVGHAAGLGGFAQPPVFELVGAVVPVDAFFIISGFLITRSWDRRPHWSRFLWHRALRILPAFWVCLAMTAFMAAPLGTWLANGSLLGFWTAPDSPFDYFKSNFLLWIAQTGISGGPTGVPVPGDWNGSLWTLYWEFLCYLGIGLLGTLGIIRNRRTIVLILFLGIWGVTLLRLLQPNLVGSLFETSATLNPLRLSLVFLAGTLLYLYRDSIPLDGRWAAVAAVLVGLSFFFGSQYRAVGGIPLAYLVIWLGVRLPARIGSKNDISYGVYIYAFPCQQLLAICGLNRLGLLPYAIGSAVTTTPFALASWYAVEKPALALKGWNPRPNGALRMSDPSSQPAEILNPQRSEHPCASEIESINSEAREMAMRFAAPAVAGVLFTLALALPFFR
ncbi:MAG: acyltransferase [Actinomycetes bacterium]